MTVKIATTPPIPVYPPGGTKPCDQTTPCIYYFYKLEQPSILTDSGIACTTEAAVWYASDPSGALANERKLHGPSVMVTSITGPDYYNDRACPANEQ